MKVIAEEVLARQCPAAI